MKPDYQLSESRFRQTTQIKVSVSVCDEIQVEPSIGNTDYCELTQRTRRLCCRAQLEATLRPEMLGVLPCRFQPFLAYR